MSTELNRPTVVLCGRPNVGKSSLFNSLVRAKTSIVHNRAGITRDTVTAVPDDAHYQLVDSAGLEYDGDSIGSVAWKKTLEAAKTASLIALVVEAQAGLLAQDQELARQLRKIIGEEKILLILNKSDKVKKDDFAEFYKLGLTRIISTSATHNIGIAELRDTFNHLTAPKPSLEEAVVDEQDYYPEQQDLAVDTPTGEKAVTIVMVGRPNVGKSTLTNKILRRERMIVSDIPGTTIDAIREEFTHRGRPAILIDTAGVRRRTSIEDQVEYLSSRLSRDSIERANIVLLLIDANEGVTHQDQRLAKLITDAGSAAVVVINKADLLDKKAKSQIKRKTSKQLPHLRTATIMLISASTPRFSAKRVIDAAFAALRQSRRKFTTAKLNRALQKAVEEFSPPRSGNLRPKLRYAHQAGIEPPLIAIHGRHTHLLTDTYKRYLVHRFSVSLDAQASPIQLKFVETNS